MASLVEYLYVIGAFQGILFAGLLIFASKAINANRILGIWCLFLGLSFLGQLIFIQQEFSPLSLLVNLNLFFPASYGPLLYLYCRTAVMDRPFSLFDLLHLAPIMMCYFIYADLVFPTGAFKLNFSSQAGSTKVLITLIIFYVQAFAYFGLSAWLIRKSQNRSKNTLSNFNPDIFSWLWKVLILYFITWSFKASADIWEEKILSIWGDVLIIVMLYSIALAQWYNPKLFRVEQLVIKPKAIEEGSSNQILSKNEELFIDNASQNSGALDSSIREGLAKAIREHMLERQAYLDNQLTLASLSEAVGVSTHHLSEVLNQQEGKNFYQFVNQYRIDYICDRLKQDQSLKILDLAMSAGFSSKSTFNAVFKQFIGSTPSQYRNKLTSITAN